MRNTLHVLSLALAGGLLASGCVYSHRAAMNEPVVAEPVLVTEAPPSPRKEVVGTPPGANQVWLSGYWMRSDQRWVWVPGHWEAPPQSGVTWVPGQWNKDASGRGWQWTPGHWE